MNKDGSLPKGSRSAGRFNKFAFSRWRRLFFGIAGLQILALLTLDDSVYGQNAAIESTVAAMPQNLQALISHSVDSQKIGSAFTFSPADLSGSNNQLPIGVFDSGIGGLTVLEAILKLDEFNNQSLAPGSDGRWDFEGESFIYFGDQANMPYGNYPSHNRLDYLRELILKDVVFLLGSRYWPSETSQHAAMDKLPVKAIAIGCNTATAFGLQDIKQAIDRWSVNVPVVGVVEAGARGVLNLHPANHDQQQTPAIAVLATVGTCNSGAYPKMIGSALGLAGRRIPPIIQQGFVELAAAIEGDQQILDRLSVHQLIDREIGSLMQQYKRSGQSTPIGTVVLGCTHFPLVREQIVAAFMQLRDQPDYQALVSSEISVVDPAKLTARELFLTLAAQRLRRTDSGSEVRSNQYFISLPSWQMDGLPKEADGSLKESYKYSRQPGSLEVEDTRITKMGLRHLPPSSINLVRSHLPTVWNDLSKQVAP